LGTSIVLRAISSFFSALVIVGIVSVLDRDEPLTILVASLCSVSLVFHVADTFMYWFQYQYRSKIIALASLCAYVGISAYRLILLITGRGILWFAVASSLDYLVLGAFYLIAYRQHNGPALRFAWKTGKRILKKSYHYILSGMMVAIYGQTDKLMLKQMLDENSVGYYSAAMTVCSMWVFILGAIIDAMYPTILRFHQEDSAAYEKKNRQLYAIVFYLSMLASVAFLLLGDFVIHILYGQSYAAAAPVLKVVTWYTAFSYLGVARNAWIVCENKQKYLKYIYMCAACLNVGLNALMIPKLGAVGAALASLITQMFTSIILPLCIRDLRPNAKLMLEAIMLRKIR
jgi:O-antigen/teichoic acid export membrane protein